ncbi:hypothetical protein Godav_028072 [Gossypium davidsonii]|uniref:Uncharacterized protein n=1 Tax=Gossypium davidsonii TaxID=34287 RepID=A0A7J8RY71_GOSDV|nr:hypothetical protein [Gossypium davidsonii]
MFQIATLEPMITGMQEALPKSIELLPFDRGVIGFMRLVKVQLSWGRKSELKVEVLRGINETGSVLYWMGLLDIVLVSSRILKRAGYHTFHANSTLVGLASWCRWANFSQNGGESPVVNLFKSSTAAIVSNPRCPNPTSFYSMSKQAEASGSTYSLVFL